MPLMDEPRTESHVRSLWVHGKLYIMIAGAVVMAVILVSIAMGLYNNSGASQFDLSGPGFKNVQSKVKNERNVASFPADGPLDQQAFNDFEKAFDQRIDNVKGINGYDPAAVSSDAFNLTAQSPQAQPTTQ